LLGLGWLAERIKRRKKRRRLLGTQNGDVYKRPLVGAQGEEIFFINNKGAIPSLEVNQHPCWYIPWFKFLNFLKLFPNITNVPCLD
jgi:hypothetical protein